jgi:hypothetical protein
MQIKFKLKKQLSTNDSYLSFKLSFITKIYFKYVTNISFKLSFITSIYFKYATN